MLAVSGAVEAARAGESGKGFAVVSNDIRGLSREASDNVERAKDTVQGILDQIATLRSDLEQIIIGTEDQVQNNRTVSAGLQNIAKDVAALAAASESILGGREQHSHVDHGDDQGRAADCVRRRGVERGVARSGHCFAQNNRAAWKIWPPRSRRSRSLADDSEAAARRDRPVEPVAQTSSTRFLTFRIEEQLYALRAADVAEVIRVPAIARVPQGPPALLGIANLRGSVLPVAGLRELLGRKAAPGLSSARAIVLDIGAPVAW